MSYVVLVLVTVVIGFVSYYVALTNVREQSIDQAISALGRSRELFEARLTEIENIAIQLSLNVKVQSYSSVRGPLDEADYEQLRDLFRSMPRYRLTNANVLDTFIYFPQSHTLISSEYASARVDLLYGAVIRFAELEYPAWQKEIAESYHRHTYWPERRLVIGNNEHSVVTYVQSFPIGSFVDYRGVTMVLARAEELARLFSDITVGAGGWFTVYDVQGRQMLTSGHDQRPDGGELSGAADDAPVAPGYREVTVDGRPVMEVVDVSPRSGWRYVAHLPAQFFLSKVEFLKRLYVGTTLLALTVGVAAALFLARRNGSPIDAIISMLKRRHLLGDSAEVSGLSYLETSISQLLSDHETLTVELEKQKPLARASFLHRLFSGAFVTGAELAEEMGACDLAIAGKTYMVCMVRLIAFDHEDEHDAGAAVRTRILARVVEEVAGPIALAHPVSSYEVAVLFSSSSDTDAELAVARVGHRVRAELSQRYRISVAIGVGNVVSDLMDVSTATDEARRAAEYSQSSRDVVFQFGDIPSSIPDYYYPLELEGRLIRLVRMGALSDVQSLLGSVRYENIENRKIAGRTLDELLSELRGTVHRIAAQIYGDDAERAHTIRGQLDRLENGRSAPELFEDLLGVFVQLCDESQERLHSHNRRLRDEALEFLGKQYVRADLNLFLVASHFGLTEKYFSQFFKEQTGENFSVYLERIRMEKARELLAESDTPIKDVASGVGYQNVNTFYKAFRRFSGVSPRVFRDRLHRSHAG